MKNSEGSLGCLKYLIGFTNRRTKVLNEAVMNQSNQPKVNSANKT